VIAGELDAGVCLDLHESAAAVADSLARHGVRPIERLDAFGLLTPDFTAVHMTHLDASDIDRAQRSGIAACLCPESDFDGAHAAALAAAGLRLALGSGAAGEESLWSAVRLVPLLARRNAGAPDRPATDRPATDRVANDWPAPWDVLAMATRGGAGALGLDAEIGTLGIGKWADLCCIDLDAPALQPTHEPAAPLVFRGSRDMVTDVWVAGRQLLAGSRFTRLDWPATAARAAAWVGRIHDEEAESW
jgi:5-methylthioadenosine/S-adenosylhomocysteine deaminase